MRKFITVSTVLLFAVAVLACQGAEQESSEPGPPERVGEKVSVVTIVLMPENAAVPTVKIVPPLPRFEAAAGAVQGLKFQSRINPNSPWTRVAVKNFRSTKGKGRASESGCANLSKGSCEVEFSGLEGDEHNPFKYDIELYKGTCGSEPTDSEVSGQEAADCTLDLVLDPVVIIMGG